MSTREDNIYYARLAEQGERYEDMIRYMKEVANVSQINKWGDIITPCILIKLSTMFYGIINIKYCRADRSYQMKKETYWV